MSTTKIHLRLFTAVLVFLLCATTGVSTACDCVTRRHNFLAYVKHFDLVVLGTYLSNGSKEYIEIEDVYAGSEDSGGLSISYPNSCAHGVHAKDGERIVVGLLKATNSSSEYYIQACFISVLQVSGNEVRSGFIRGASNERIGMFSKKTTLTKLERKVKRRK